MRPGLGAAPALVLPVTRRHAADWGVVLIGLALVLLWDLSGLDRPVMHLLGDASGFAWKEHWLTARLIHGGGRLLAWLALALLLVNVWRPLWAGHGLRMRLVWVAVTALCVLAVPLLKQFSHTSCPWDLAEFGGWAPYVSHWQLRLSDGGPGHCFPSGHASAAFAFFSGWFALRDHQPRAARAWLATVLVVGLVFGIGQTMRGAHHPSHTLWTAWLCWTLCTVLMQVQGQIPGQAHRRRP